MSAVGLTSTSFEIALVALTLAVPLGALLLWQRVPGPRPVRVAQRFGLVAAAQAVAVLLAFTVVNDQYVFYASWSDLLGRPTSAPPVMAVDGLHHRVKLGADGGRMMALTVTGPVSGLTEQVLVHLPPEYDEPAYEHRSFPVVMFLNGWDNYPDSWTGRMHLTSTFRDLAARHGIQPFISVFPTVNVAFPRDAECTNIPGSTQAFSWLDSDVPRWVMTHFRALKDAASWATVGYSTGGYCAVKLAFLDPARFHVAVSMSGYFGAVRDHSTGDLWGGSLTVREHNDLVWLAEHHRRPAVDVLVFTTRQDRGSYPSSVRFLGAAESPTRMFSIIAPTGAHNFKVLTLALPEIVQWVSAHLSPSGALPAPTAAPTGSVTRSA